MVIRFPRLRLAKPNRHHVDKENALRRLSRREVEHRERMLRHLELMARHG